MPAALAHAGGRNVGDRAQRASCCTRAASSITPTACRTRSARSTSSSPPAASASRTAATARSSARATARAGASTGRSAISCPGWRDISNPEHRRYIAGVWGIDEARCPGPGVDAYEMFRKIDTGEIKGLLSICFNPKVSLPDNTFVTRCLDKLEFYVAIDFFLERHRAPRRHRAAGQPARRGRRHGDAGRRAGSSRSTKRSTVPARRAQDWRIIQDIARALGRPHGFTFSEPREIFDELRVASKGGVADYSGMTYEKIEREMGVFWPCYAEDPEDRREAGRSPGDAAAVRAGQLQPDREGRRTVLFSRRPRALQRRRLPRAGRRCQRGVSDLPDDRPRGQPVPVGHADAPHRPARQPVPGAAHRDASAAGREARASPIATGPPPRRGAARSRCARWW